MARVNCIQLEDNDLKAQEDYDNLFYKLECDSEEGSDQQDFCRPLQHSDFPNQPNKPNSESLGETSSLEGTEGINLPLGAEITQPSDLNLSDTNSFKVDLVSEPSFSSKNLSSTPKVPLNRNTRRRLAREIAEVHHSISNNSSGSKPLVELRKHQVRPPGCSFLGSQAAQVPATVNFLDKNLTKVIIDSGSDITLILQNHSLKCKPPLNFDKDSELI